MDSRITLAAITVLLMSVSAHATEQICPYYAPQDWMPRENVEAQARELGFQNFFVQPDGGCWTIYATENGTRVEIMLDPKTGAIVQRRAT